eukprot:1181365-Prorocentrum_minimum.AAC.6
MQTIGCVDPGSRGHMMWEGNKYTTSIQKAPNRRYSLYLRHSPSPTGGGPASESSVFSEIRKGLCDGHAHSTDPLFGLLSPTPEAAEGRRILHVGYG